nr:immunoglobulin heavy chain junction region [Mus musculus]NSM06785.1 immunoglobulin heavy chain junction region [Mus musculus]NSM08114.1 immunoglobulin heavy chain junction region [Mus musculus]
CARYEGYYVYWYFDVW